MKLSFALLLALLAVVCAAPLLAPNLLAARFNGLLNAPPTRVHLRDASGGWHAPFIHPLKRLSQLEQTYEEGPATVVPLRWLSGGRLVQSSQPEAAPLLLLGADAFGRDVFSRTLHGGRLSLGIALIAALGAVVVGVLIGSLAGYSGGLLDDALMRTSDMILVLPTMYVVMVLRAALPLVLSPALIFALLAGLFAIVGAPILARTVRGVVRSERTLEYAAAAQSLGASAPRVLFRHLVPAATGLVLIEAMMLVPGFVIAEATLSFVGFGFPDTVATWGTMLHEASSVRAMADFPWLFAPAVAIFLVVLGVNAGISRRHGGLASSRPL